MPQLELQHVDQASLQERGCRSRSHLCRIALSNASKSVGQYCRESQLMHLLYYLRMMVMQVTRGQCRTQLAATLLLCLFAYPGESVAVNKYALVIGINAYKKLEATVPNLKYAENDAVQVAKILKDLDFKVHLLPGM